MPGLLRGVARTAVIAGTASAVNGRVQRRQAEKYADRDAAIAAERTQSYQEQMAAAAPAPAPVAAAPAPAAPATDVVAQLRSLAGACRPGHPHRGGARGPEGQALA